MLSLTTLPRSGLWKVVPVHRLSASSSVGLLNKIVFLPAAISLGVGSVLLAGAVRASEPVALRAWLGMLILAVAVVQVKRALKLLKQRRRPRGTIFRRTSFWRMAFTGAVFCYVISLAFGPAGDAPWIFLAGLAVWHGHLLLPIAVDPQAELFWRRIIQQRIARYSSMAFFSGAVLLVACEVLLRGHAWMFQQAGTPFTFISNSAIAAETSAETALAGTHGPVRDFQLMLTGDLMAFGGDTSQKLLAELQGRLPASGTAGIDEPRRLVLLFVAPAARVVHERLEDGWFDWRSLAVSQWLGGHEATGPAVAVPNDEAPAPPPAAAAEVLICRTPTDELMQRRWQKTFGKLDGLIEECHQANLEVALVFVPAEFQLNELELQARCRRLGVNPADIDLHLPQRRLASFANQRAVPCIDLAPHLRLCQEPVYPRAASGLSEEARSIVLGTLGDWLGSRYGTRLAAR